jgi:hypothetical protein
LNIIINPSLVDDRRTSHDRCWQIYISACLQVLQFKEMTEAAFAAAGAANRQDFLPALRLLDFGRTRRKLADLAKARHQFGQSLVDEYRRRHHRPCNAAAAEEETPPPRTVIGDLLREQERSPESHDDVVIRTVCLVREPAGWSTRCTLHVSR